jgi:YVTN family beta-propeller protein
MRDPARIAGLRLLVCAAAALLCAACGPSARTPLVPATQAAAPTPATAPKPRKPVALDIYAGTRAGMLSVAVAGLKPLVYVPNSDSNTVTVIDPKSFAVLRTFKVGLMPEHITPSWDLQTLYVDNTSGNTLIPIDPRTGVAGLPIPVYDPYNLYFTPDGSKAIVVAERNRTLDIRDPKSWKLLARIPTPCDGVDHGDFTADHRFFLVSCEYSGELLRVDTRALRVVGVLKLGGRPIDVRLSPDGRIVYVANQAPKFGGVQLVDPSAMRLLQFIPTGAGAHGEIPSRDGRSLYVTNRLGHTVSVIDFATRKVVRTWTIPHGSPDMGGVSTDGSRLWLSGRYNREVYVIDTGSGMLLARIPVGAGPHGLCLFPQPGSYSLGHTGNYR